MATLRKPFSLLYQLFIYFGALFRVEIESPDPRGGFKPLEMHASDTLSRAETWHLFILVGAGLGILVNTFQGDGAPLIASGALSVIAFAITFSMIRWLGPVFIKAGLKGKDMAKPRRPEM